MLIPTFSLSQTAEMVMVEIRVPFVRVSNMEFHVDGKDFHFYCKPYLLKLTLPHEVVDDERAGAEYDVNKENGTVTCRVPKLEQGLHFENLDLITTLLAPSLKTAPGSSSAAAAATSSGPMIEVLSSSTAEAGADESSEQALEQARH